MVRVIISDGDTWANGGHTFTGPLELVLESATLGGELRSSGEFCIVGASAVQTLPYLREEMSTVFPLVIVMALFAGLSWLKKIL